MIFYNFTATSHMWFLTWCIANAPVESNLSKHKSQILFLVRFCDAEGELQGMEEGADGVVIGGMGLGDLKFWLFSRHEVCPKTKF